MSQISGYTLDLYCDNQEKGTCKGFGKYDTIPVTYCHEVGAVCRARAKKDGWVLSGLSGALCPACSGKKEGWLRL
jgi:hypothetical protein